MLGRLRLGPGGLHGRRYPEPAHPYRNDFQRDRDRIIHSRAFRRLEGKTQVFAAGFGDHFRNRLTHTIEVSQVARTVTCALQLNEEYAETLALAHDLGHPPFGHSGEKELDRQMRRFNDTFEHNNHALRIVDVLEERYARFDGLNLTHEVREGVLKHSRELARTDDPAMRDLRPGEKPPLEAQLLDLADEIAYNTADVDDAFFAGLLTIDDIASAVPVFAQLAEAVDTQFPGVTPRVRLWEIERQMINILIGGLIDGTVTTAGVLGVQTVDDVRALSQRVAVMTPETESINGQLKGLLVSYVYCNEQLAEQRAQASQKVGELFEFLLQNQEFISAGYRESLAFNPAHRVVCDFIAGMTDGYFMRTYNSLIKKSIPRDRI